MGSLITYLDQVGRDTLDSKHVATTAHLNLIGLGFLVFQVSLRLSTFFLFQSLSLDCLGLAH